LGSCCPGCRHGSAAPAQLPMRSFAFYHLWTLWLTPTRILAVLPLIYITLRTRSGLPAMVAHVVLNLVDVVVIIAFVIRPG
jgi:membrane protease YdiL (CAAX protease family)